ncbi:MAG TPA: AAA family ATPase, partial [Candidatus Thermoplasmatota archaeon]
DRAALADPRVPLWLTEGEKKALKGCQEGLCCVAVPGVWSWKTRDARDRSVPIADLDAIAWRGRIVFLVFDSDLATKPQVRLAEFALARELQHRGAIVKAVRLPAGSDGAKVGLDDYLVTHSVETLCALEPVAVLDPALDPGAPVSERLGHGHRVTWPAHDVVVTVTGFREHSEGIAAEVAVTRGGTELHWSKVNLAGARSRDELARKLGGTAPRVPWGPIVERTCRLCVEAARAGNPAVAIIPRIRMGPRYAVEPIAPAGETTVMAGDGGAGKSYATLALALGISSDAPLPAGLRVEIGGPVLYLDWESTEEEFAERVLYLAKGLGCRVRDLHYKPMVAPLTAELAAVQADVHRLGVVAVVIDSLAPASGPEPEGADAAVRTMTALRSLSPASRIVVAHVSKASADGAGPARPFGSVFIQNLARSVWEVRRSDDETGDDLLLGLYHRKVNSGRKHRPLALRLSFGADAVTLQAADLTEAPDLLNRTSLVHRLRTALAREPLAVDGLAERLGVGEDTVRRTLNRYRAKRLFVPLADSKPQLWALGSAR